MKSLWLTCNKSDIFLIKLVHQLQRIKQHWIKQPQSARNSWSKQGFLSMLLPHRTIISARLVRPLANLDPVYIYQLVLTWGFSGVVGKCTRIVASVFINDALGTLVALVVLLFSPIQLYILVNATSVRQ